MALIKCKECGNEISKTAKTCPKCGAPNKQQSKVAVGCLTIFVIVFFLGLIGALMDEEESTQSTETSSNTTKSDEKLVVSESVKKQVLDFEQKIYEIEKPALTHVKAFSTAAKNLGTKYSIYDLYGYANNAQNACFNTWRAYSDLRNKVPKSIPKIARKMLEESADNMHMAYYTKKEAFKHAKKFLDDQKPSLLQKYKEEITYADQYTLQAVAKLFEAKNALSLNISNDEIK